MNGALGPIPSDVGSLRAWASAAAAYSIDGDGGEKIGLEAAGLARDYHKKHVIERGHAPGWAEQVARFIFRDAADAA